MCPPVTGRQENVHSLYWPTLHWRLLSNGMCATVRSAVATLQCKTQLSAAQLLRISSWIKSALALSLWRRMMNQCYVRAIFSHALSQFASDSVHVVASTPIVSARSSCLQQAVVLHKRSTAHMKCDEVFACRLCHRSRRAKPSNASSNYSSSPCTAPAEAATACRPAAAAATPAAAAD